MTGKPLRVVDAYSHPLFNPGEQHNGFRTRGICAFRFSIARDPYPRWPSS
jgi:hypothetical protein